MEYLDRHGRNDWFAETPQPYDIFRSGIGFIPDHVGKHRQLTQETMTNVRELCSAEDVLRFVNSRVHTVLDEEGMVLVDVKVSYVIGRP